MRFSGANPRAAKKPRRHGQSPSAGAEKGSVPPLTTPEEVRQLVQEELLAQITHGGRLCCEIEREFGRNPAPELETLIKLHRVLILKFSAEAHVNPELFKLVCDLMKPAMEWARLQEQRKAHQLAEQKYRDSTATKAAREGGEDGLTEGTLQKIEKEIKLF
jgi:hypothetical protein